MFANKILEQILKKIDYLALEVNEIKTLLSKGPETKPEVKKRSSNTGYRHIYWTEVNKKYEVKFRHNEKMIYVGCYKEIEKAIEARKIAYKTLGIK